MPRLQQALAHFTPFVNVQIIAWPARETLAAWRTHLRSLVLVHIPTHSLMCQLPCSSCHALYQLHSWAPGTRTSMPTRCGASTGCYHTGDKAERLETRIQSAVVSPPGRAIHELAALGYACM